MPSRTDVTTCFCEPARQLLAAYPHAAECPTCRQYAADALAQHSTPIALSATLAHHESFHRADPLLTASEHFAIDTEPTLA